MNTLLTGATGYIGSYVAHDLLKNPKQQLTVLVRAKNKEDAWQRLWQAWQMHMDFPEFWQTIQDRVTVCIGDLTAPRLGLDTRTYNKLVQHVTSILHCAASLNRKSEKTCLNVNLRGALHMMALGKAIHESQGLRRFSLVSTVAVAGERQDEMVIENNMIEWARNDYDPYARTKKFSEYMLNEMLPDTPKTIFRPSIVMGDSRFGHTTQFDMVKAFVWLSQLPVLPFRKEWRADIVNTDFVSQAMATLHSKNKTRFESYNLSSGAASLTYVEIVQALSERTGKPSPIFAPLLQKPAEWLICSLAATPRALRIGKAFTLLKVFWPYLVFNTVFDNTRVKEETGLTPTPFSAYAYELRTYALKNRYHYRYQPWPPTTDKKKDS